MRGNAKLLFLHGSRLTGAVAAQYRDGAIYLNSSLWKGDRDTTANLDTQKSTPRPARSLSAADSMVYSRVPYIAKRVDAGAPLQQVVREFSERKRLLLAEAWRAYHANLSAGNAVAADSAMATLDPELVVTDRGSANAPRLSDLQVRLYFHGYGGEGIIQIQSEASNSTRTRMDENQARAEIAFIKHYLDGPSSAVVILSATASTYLSQSDADRAIAVLRDILRSRPAEPITQDLAGPIPARQVSEILRATDSAQ